MDITQRFEESITYGDVTITDPFLEINYKDGKIVIDKEGLLFSFIRGSSSTDVTYRGIMDIDSGEVCDCNDSLVMLEDIKEENAKLREMMTAMSQDIKELQATLNRNPYETAINTLTQEVKNTIATSGLPNVQDITKMLVSLTNTINKTD